MDILSAQIALFPSELIRRPDSLYEKVNKQMGGLFDAIPTILPVPENAPPEIPIVQMSSLDGRYRASIARNRIDFFCLALNTENTFEGITIRKATGYIKQFAEKPFLNMPVSRVGCVFAAFKEDPNAIQTIARRYLLGEEFKKSSELSISRNNPGEHRGVKINRLLKISSGRLKKGSVELEGIIIEQDLNTLQAETIEVDKFTITYLIDKMSSSMGDKELEKLL